MTVGRSVFIDLIFFQLFQIPEIAPTLKLSLPELEEEAAAVTRAFPKWDLPEESLVTLIEEAPDRKAWLGLAIARRLAKGRLGRRAIVSWSDADNEIGE